MPPSSFCHWLPLPLPVAAAEANEQWWGFARGRASGSGSRTREWKKRGCCCCWWSPAWDAPFQIRKLASYVSWDTLSFNSKRARFEDLYSAHINDELSTSQKIQWKESLQCILPTSIYYHTSFSPSLPHSRIVDFAFSMCLISMCRRRRPFLLPPPSPASFLVCFFNLTLSLFQSHSLTFSLSLTCTNIFSHVFSSTVRTTIPIPSLARGSRGFGSKWADWKEWRKLTHIKASKTFLPSAEGRIIIKLMERNRRKPSTLRFSKDQRTTNTLVVSFKKEILKDYWLSHLSLKTLFVNQFRVPFVGKCWRRRKWWFRFFVVGDRLLFARIGHNLIFQESLSSLIFEYSYNAASLLITFKK